MGPVRSGIPDIGVDRFLKWLALFTTPGPWRRAVPFSPNSPHGHAGDPHLTVHHPSGVSQRRPSDLGPSSDGSRERYRDFTAPLATGRIPVPCGSSEAPPGPIRRGDQEPRNASGGRPSRRSLPSSSCSGSGSSRALSSVRNALPSDDAGVAIRMTGMVTRLNEIDPDYTFDFTIAERRTVISCRPRYPDVLRALPISSGAQLTLNDAAPSGLRTATSCATDHRSGSRPRTSAVSTWRCQVAWAARSPAAGSHVTAASPPLAWSPGPGQRAVVPTGIAPIAPDRTDRPGSPQDARRTAQGTFALFVIIGQ